ncbi:MAG TPA: TIR domain-containing protein [Vicinamibacterales bacterium]|nr:TIR domain-containing protein [Vicinamibacterales bacterium]
MADIFVSYATEDRERARTVAQALEERGWDVWWDREIPLGRLYDDAIEQALAAARCAIVLWSRTSVASEWVRSEASEAKRRGILVPVFLDTIEPPLAFRLLQGADLAAWEPGTPHEEFDKLVERIGELLTPQPATSAAAPGRAAAESPVPAVSRRDSSRGYWRYWRYWMAAAVAAAVVLAVATFALGTYVRGRTDAARERTSSAAKQPVERAPAPSPKPAAPEQQNERDTAPLSDLAAALGGAISSSGAQDSMAALTMFDVKELSVKLTFVSDRDAAGLGFVGALPAGAVVLEVGPGPAQRAGLHAGDVITAIGDAHIQSADDLRQAVRRVGPGKTRYGVRRNDRTLAIDIECPDCTNP